MSYDISISAKQKNVNNMKFYMHLYSFYVWYVFSTENFEVPNSKCTTCSLYDWVL